MNVPWFDIVLGNGERVRCSADENAELYRAVPGCYGTSGIITRAAVHLIEAKRYVHSHYRHFARVSDYVAAFGDALDQHQYVEGFIMGPDSHVLITGDFADEQSGVPTYHAMRAGNLWYYEHAAKLARRGGEDLVPTYEYVFRHMRSLLWVSRFANFLYLPMTRLGRWVLDTRVMQELHEYGLVSAIPHDERERSVVMEDTAISLDRLEAGIEYAKQNFGVYPFWNCAAGHAQRGPYSKRRRHGDALHHQSPPVDPRAAGARRARALHGRHRLVRRAHGAELPASQRDSRAAELRRRAGDVGRALFESRRVPQPV
jgi:delta24-sterol reductase